MLANHSKRFQRKSQASLLIHYIVFLFIGCQPQPRFPDEVWMQYTTPEEAGWSTVRLVQAKTYADSIGSAAFMLVYDGAVVTTYGDIGRRYMCHSVRKSFLSALYGIHAGEGHIDVYQTLLELNIDDKDQLTESEKQATVLDMLKARSGVYHPAAYEMAASRPARGSHLPGSFWYYNNWDFNTLLTIFEQETGTHIFEEFNRRVAEPLQMQDYRVRDGYYHLEAEHSIHPAFPFRMSTRDMARFGLLYLQEGQWQGQQLIPQSWVRESTQSYSDLPVDYNPMSGFGYMWWILGADLKQYGAYAALGVGAQTITILPDLNMVFIHRVDTYAGDRVSLPEVYQLLRLLIDAKVGEGSSNPNLILSHEPSPSAQFVTLSPSILEGYAKTYTYPGGTSFKVLLDLGQLVIDFPRFGKFGLYPLSATEFLVEDSLLKVYFEKLANDGVTCIAEGPLNSDGYALLRQGQVDQAIEAFKLNVLYYPSSTNVYDSLGEAYMAQGNKPLAIQNYMRVLELNPNNANAVQKLKELSGE